MERVHKIISFSSFLHTLRALHAFFKSICLLFSLEIGTGLLSSVEYDASIRLAQSSHLCPIAKGPPHLKWPNHMSKYAARSLILSESDLIFQRSSSAPFAETLSLGAKFGEVTVTGGILQTRSALGFCFQLLGFLALRQAGQILHFAGLFDGF